MRIVVLGAGGGVGRRAVAAAVQQGHDVVAVARTEPDAPAGATALAVDVRDPGGVDRAIAGADALLWCVGVTKRSGPDPGRTAMPHLLRSAERAGVLRLVSVSGAGVTLQGDAKGPGARFISAVTRRLARDLVMDKEGEHRALEASGLAWTEVRPPRLADTDGTGRWALVEQAPGLRAPAVAKADVALAMLALVGSRDWLRRSPFLVAG